MIKRILAGVAALSLVFTVGCGTPKKEAAGGAKEIYVVARGGADKGVVQGLIEKFNNDNNGKIKIKYDEKDDTMGEYLRVALQAGNAPDILEGFSNATKEMALAEKWLRPLDEATVAKYKDLLVEGSVRKEIDGNVYKVCTSTGGTFRLIWNKDMFKECGLDPEKPPVTWDEVRENAKILTQNGGGRKYGFAISFKNEGFARLYVMMPGAPSNLYNDDGYEPAKGKFDFSIYEPMTRLYKNMVDDGSVFPTPVTLDNDTARAQFAEGNIGMMLAARWDAGVFHNQFPCKMDWGIANFPTFTGKVTGSFISAAASGGRYMSSTCKYPDEQLKVWEFFHGEEFSKEYQAKGLGISTFKSLNKPELLDGSVKGYRELNIPDEGTRLHYIDSPTVPQVSVMGDNYEKAFAAMVMGQLDIKQGLSELTDRYNKGLEEWKSKSGNDINDYIVPDYDPNTYVPQ